MKRWTVQDLSHNLRFIFVLAVINAVEETQLSQPWWNNWVISGSELASLSLTGTSNMSAATQTGNNTSDTPQFLLICVSKSLQEFVCEYSAESNQQHRERSDFNEVSWKPSMHVWSADKYFLLLTTWPKIKLKVEIFISIRYGSNMSTIFHILGSLQNKYIFPYVAIKWSSSFFFRILPLFLLESSYEIRDL